MCQQSIDQLARRLCANNHGKQQDQGEQTEENKNGDKSMKTRTRMFSNDKSKTNTKTIFLNSTNNSGATTQNNDQRALHRNKH